MEPSSRKIVTSALDYALTVATILAAAAVLWTLGEKFVRGNAPEIVGPGAPIELPGVNWDKTATSLVLVLQADCPYCTASVPFYRDLIAANASGATQFIAVFPHAVSVGREVLKSHGLDIQTVSQANLRSLGISGTPTLLLVNQQGVVKRTWIGQLSAVREDDVFSELRIKRLARSGAQKGGQVSNLIPSPDQVRALKSGIPIIDSRPRADFQRAHIEGSLNIPLDELEARLIHELPDGATALLYCQFCPECAVVVDSGEGQSLCEASMKLIGQLGASSLQVIESGIDSLEAAGVGVNRRH